MRYSFLTLGFVYCHIAPIDVKRFASNKRTADARRGLANFSAYRRHRARVGGLPATAAMFGVTSGYYPAKTRMATIFEC
jgi:hypothetical protein